MRSYSEILLLCLSIDLWCTTINAQSKYPEVSWRVDEYTNRSCRAEDGYYKCKGFESEVQICVWRRDAAAYGICDTSPLLNCTDREIRILDLDICQPRSKELGTRYIRCHPDEFRCLTSKQCIPRSWVQDGKVDCSPQYTGENIKDRSDEENVLQTCHLEAEYSCHGDLSRCIPRHMVMDGYEDCPNGTDEDHALTCHNDTEFYCSSNKRCILRRYVNDNFTDCPNNTDENVRNFTCIDHLEFSCRNGRCIPRRWVGNGVEDCSSGEDETELLSICYGDEFGCLDQRRCLPKKYLCDGVQNCRDGSDEIELCNSPTMYRSPDSQTLIPWSNLLGDVIPSGIKRDFQPGKYLMFGFKCLTQLLISGTFELSNEHKRSTKRRTIPQFYIENNHSVCYNKEDVCYDQHGKFMCARCFDGTIISTSQLCDNKIDCRDLSDECTCEESEVEGLCKMVYPTFSVQHNPTKLDANLICDGREDAENGVDERFCVDVNFIETTDQPLRLLENITCSREPFNNTFPNQTEATYCDGNVECRSLEDECSFECLTWKLNMNEISSHSQFVNNCFPFLKPIYDTDGKFGFYRFETQAPRFPGKKEKLIHKDSEENSTCQYKLIPLRYTEYKYEYLLIENSEMNRCNLGAYHRRLAFLCTIEGVDCPWLYSCESGKTKKIEISKRCDYYIDCEDKSDERNCSTATHFYCTSGTPFFIRRSQVGDGRSDCTDRSDECRETAFSSAKEMIKNEFLRYFVWLSAISIVISNIIVITKHIRKMKKIVSKKSIPFWNTILLINLACSDMMFGVTLLAIGIKSYQFSGKYCEFDLEWRSSTTCNLIGILTVISSQSSMNLLVLMTGLRMYTTCYRPFMANELNMKILIFLSLLSWGISFLIAFFPIWSNPLFSHELYIKSNLFFNDQIVKRNHAQTYVTRTKILVARTISGYQDNETSKVFDFESLKGWHFDTHEGRIKFPNRHIDIKGHFGFYSSSSVCFPDFYSQISPASEYSLGIILYNLLSIVSIIIGYFLIFNSVKRRKTSVRSSHSNAVDQEQVKMTIRIIYIVITDMACWVPVIGMTIASYVGYELPDIVHSLSAIVFLPVNSFLNPVIYSRLDRSVRRRLAQLCSTTSTTSPRRKRTPRKFSTSSRPEE